MDKNTLKVVFGSLAYIIVAGFFGVSIFVLFIPLYLELCNANEGLLSGLEIIIRIVVIVIFGIVLHYLLPKKLVPRTRKYWPIYTDGPLSPKLLRDTAVLIVVIVFLIYIFILEPELFGFKNPIDDYLLPYMKQYITNPDVLSSCAF